MEEVETQVRPTCFVFRQHRYYRCSLIYLPVLSSRCDDAKEVVQSGVDQLAPGRDTSLRCPSLTRVRHARTQ